MNPEQIHLRDARRPDLRRIVHIYNTSIPDRMATADLAPVTVTSRQQWFAQHQSRPDTPLIVAELTASHVVAGWASLSEFYGREAYAGTREIAVYVHPDYQGIGVASTLIDAILRRAKEHELHSIMAYVFSHNSPSLTLFRRFGFSPWGHCPDIARLDGQPCSLDILGLSLPTNKATPE